MNNEIGLLVKDIPQDDLQAFLKQTSAKTTVEQIIDKVTVDYSWVDVLNESVPYLDNIIRNPRRFIVAEEDIVPIEKTKKVAEESIKHLAVHTNLIQEVDEKGMVKPIKLLNVFKEETIDLYENRFIYSLITNLYTFVRNQLTYQDESASNKEQRSFKYEAFTKFNNKDINISVNMVSKNNDEELMTEEEIEERQAKIKHIKEILEDFMASKFMKAMSNATPVRSPIRKTNVILKEQNFIKALELWEFLESYQIKKPVIEINEEKEITNDNFKEQFGMTYFLNYCVLNEVVSKNGTLRAPLTASLPKMVYEYAKKFDIDEKNLRDEILNELNKAENFKLAQINGSMNAYKSFIDNHKSKIEKSLLLIK